MWLIVESMPQTSPARRKSGVCGEKVAFKSMIPSGEKVYVTCVPHKLPSRVVVTIILLPSFFTKHVPSVFSPLFTLVNLSFSMYRWLS